MGVIDSLLASAEGALAMRDGAAASHAFYEAVSPLGASYLQSRVYRRPEGPLTSESHWRAGGVIARISRPAWPQSSGYRYICFECNPLLEPVRAGRGRWKFSDYAPRAAAAYRDYWDAMSEAGIDDALGVIARGASGRIANIHLGVADRETPRELERGLWFAALLLAERLLELDAPAPNEAPRLTSRERDCLAYVSAGKTDWEISVILAVSEATVRFHVDNGRRKLGAVTRSQAVAKLALWGML